MISTFRFPKGQGHLLRDEILRATIELLDEVDDIAGVSIRAVAMRVGRTTPQVYEHFKGREDLLRAAALAVLDRLSIVTEDAIGGEQDFRRRLRIRAHSFVSFARQHPNAYRLTFMESSVGTGLNLEGLLTTAAITAVIEDLKTAKRHGRLQGNPKQIAVTMLAALHGIASLQIAHPTVIWPSNMTTQMLDQLAEGIIPR